MNMLNALIASGVDADTAKAFCEYHVARPQIWKKFEAKSLELIERGFVRWGAKCIMEVIRYEESIETRGEFKICNSYTAYYARAFGIKYPHLKGFFETRDVKGLSEQSRKVA